MPHRAVVLPFWPALAIVLAVGAAPGCAAPRPTAPTAAHLYVVAHQDDDLLFANPHLDDDIRAGHDVVTVFVTAGDAGADADYWNRREAGIHAAYAYMAGVDDRWTRQDEVLADHALVHDTLVDAPWVSLFFLRLPDGAPGGGGFGHGSLLQLWSGQRATLARLDDPTVEYTVETLVQTLVALMYAVDAAEVHTLEDPDARATSFPADHSDHVITARLVLEAALRYARPHALTLYRTYAIRETPVNVRPEQAIRKREAFKRYNAFYGCWNDPEPRACLDQYDGYAGWYGGFFQHMVAAETIAAGELRPELGARCLVAADDGTVGLGACDGDPAGRWRISPTGELRAPDERCLALDDISDGDVRLTDCDGGETQRWIVLDDGRVRAEGGLCLASPPAANRVAPVRLAPCRQVPEQAWCGDRLRPCQR